MIKPYEVKQEDRSGKTRLRMWTFNLWRQEAVLDLYAGLGGMARQYAPRCERLICVEKDVEVFEKLETNLSSFDNAVLYNCDNMDFLEDVGEIPDISFVDFDAYGCPNLQIQKFFKKYPVERAITVNVTDGTLYNLSRTVNINLKKYFLMDLYPRGRLSESDYYSKHRLRRVLPWLQEAFIHLLAAKHEFNTIFLYHAMNRATNVTYYGFIAYPECEAALPWASGKTPIIRFKKDRELIIKTLKKHIRERA